MPRKPAVAVGDNQQRYSQEYYTPRWLFDRLHAKFDFTLDPASCAEADKGIPYYTKEQDGLTQSWTGERVFCNPPFDQTASFFAKVPETSAAVFLVPARVETLYWHTLVWPVASEVLFFRTRLQYTDGDGVSYARAPFASCLIAFHGLTFEGFEDLGVRVVPVR